MSQYFLKRMESYGLVLFDFVQKTDEDILMRAVLAVLQSLSRQLNFVLFSDTNCSFIFSYFWLPFNLRHNVAAKRT